ncbi:MAG: hypothetical protein OEM41_10255, partial [Ignavibacteria bacterium]|nr:hypothetical protein [Ignavibacteria bacterium]
CMHNPMITYNWHAQFEDTRPKALYRNLSRREAVEMAILFFTDTTAGAARVAPAEELLRFAEDQFVVWDSTDPAWRERWFREGAAWEHNTPSGGKDWFLPCVMEQYVFFTPIASSSGLMITGYLSAYRETRKPLYHAKAVALANTLTRAQKFHGGGEIPTYLREHLPDWNWINVSVWSALTLITHAEELREEAHD